MKRRKRRLDVATVASMVRLDESGWPLEHPRICDDFIVSTDGSAGSSNGIDVAGWGFTVNCPSSQHLLDYCGPVVISAGHPDYVGAAALTNNTAELSALANAFSWLIYNSNGASVTVDYDSAYAHAVITRLWRPLTNISLVLRCRALYDCVKRQILWRKVASHTGDFLNERADKLASFGATDWSGNHAVIRPS